MRRLLNMSSWWEHTLALHAGHGGRREPFTFLQPSNLPCPIKRADRAQRTAVDHMSVDHRRPYVLVPEQRLADVGFHGLRGVMEPPQHQPHLAEKARLSGSLGFFIHGGLSSYSDGCHKGFRKNPKRVAPYAVWVLLPIHRGKRNRPAIPPAYYARRVIIGWGDRRL